AKGRLLQPFSIDSFPDRILHRVSRHQEPAGKKGASVAAVSRSTHVRANRPKALTSENLKKRQLRQPSSRIPAARSKGADYTIKRKEWKFKTLSPFIKTGQRLRKTKNHSENQVEGK